MRKSENSFRVSCLSGTAAVISAVVLLAGCTSSRLSNEWRDPAFRASPLKNVLIVCVKKNPMRRRLWEDGFEAELAERGVLSTPSYRLFPDAVPDTDQVENAIQEKGYDGVLVVTRLQTETTSRYVPGDVRTVPATRYDRLNHSYYTVYRQVEDSGYVETDKLVRHQIDVWATGEGGRMIWAATGETLDPSSGKQILDEITDLIVPELADQGIIQGK